MAKDKPDYNSAPVTCCTTNGQRALGLTPQYACTLSEQGDVYINLLFDMKKYLVHEKNTVHLEMHTDFPRTAGGTLSIQSSGSCTCHIRVPAWADQPVINGISAQPGTYFALPVHAGETQITFQLGMRLRLLTPGFSNRGKYALAYGPLLLAVDSLPERWSFDEIMLELPQNLRQIPIQDENGWPRIDLTARRVSAEIGELCMDELIHKGTETVTLRPYLFCGISEHNRECAQKYESYDLVYDREGKRTEYRVTVPCVVVK